MPPLPVVRAQLLGMLQAPAGKLVRTIAEPARGLAAVLKASQRKRPPQRNRLDHYALIKNHLYARSTKQWLN